MSHKSSSEKKTTKKENVPSAPIQMLYGYRPDIVKKMNANKPFAEILHAQFPKGPVKRQMKEKHRGVKCFEIPVVFKNEFHAECLSEDYYCACAEEVKDYIKKTYAIVDEGMSFLIVF